MLMQEVNNAHTYSYEDILKNFESSDTKGLSSDEANKRNARFGLNSLSEKKRHEILEHLLEQIKDPIILILLTACIIKIATGGLTDGLAIGVVIIFNTILSTFQKLKAIRAISSLKLLIQNKAYVIRDGIKQEIESRFITLGDILVLESGMKIPADARIISSINLSVNESMLTGESVPVAKNPKLELKKETPCQEQKNMVFSGTLVSSGRALACVTQIGAQTEIGKIASSLESIDQTDSPLQIRMAKFGKVLSLGVVIWILAIISIGFLKGYSLNELFLMGIGLAVCAIPEALPLAITVCLTVGVMKMAKQKAIVKHMSCVESLGAATVICSDKTGTLTCNEMTVTEFFMGHTNYHVTGTGYEPLGSIDKPGDFFHLGLISSYCSESILKHENGKWICLGDPTEASLLTLAKKMKQDFSGYSFKLLIPFESENRYMATEVEKDGKKYLLMKGSLEKILAFTTKVQLESGKLEPVNKELLLEKEKELSIKGLRTLALAYKEIDSKHQDLSLDHAVFAGLVGIQDPLRPNAKSSVQKCLSAGVSVKMITGDLPETALNIYKTLMGKSLHYNVMKGEQIDRLSPIEKETALCSCDVFARVSPYNKLEIVEALQKKGHIVAMTGDGVNDAPCLKKAHIGIAMGSGTDTAKDASSIILLDDNFSTLEKAIARGRMTFLILQNLTSYLLTTALGSVITLSFSVFLGLPIPLLPIQLLWINLVTDGSSTLPMCFEEPSHELMEDKPIKMNEPLVQKSHGLYIVLMGAWMSACTLTSFVCARNYQGFDLLTSQTIAFTTLAFFQIWNVQNSRSKNQSLFFNYRKSGKIIHRLKFKNNPYLLATMLIAFGLQVAAVELSFLNPFLKTVSLSRGLWLQVTLVSFSIVIASELFKFIKQKKGNHSNA